MKSKKISVIIPCYNGGKFIRQNVEKISDYLANNFLDYEIIIVNDGSFDNTREEIFQVEKNLPKIILIDNEINSGKGHAVKGGILKSRYETVMFLDADLAIPIESLENFIEALDDGFDIAIASRFVPGLKVTKPVLWHRQFMEKIFRLLRMVITNNYSIQDTQCGFKVFSREVAMKIFPLMTIDRFAFDAEVIFVAVKSGYWIKELPIILQNPTESSIRIYRDSLNMLLDLIRIRINYFSGKYTGKISIDKD
ncbi:MAG: glycosyltransferase [Parcubacteria group bacterium]|jgi:glycosyltransferase involved in cell wall biosynthesis|nr:MAG: Glycosyl transferase family 2 [Candidatus Moranbacteria bacterium GW2011_GWF1_36_78]KKQ16523.1 MAG: Glycosyl transferase family 2 [Candidatus Moranbacteria bacterium GW2011_GWF2_36_839]HAT74174.1 glycosyl transferase [Candidatus Moranbacteria bacterium]HBY11441.1 glycosyl transferase [Candidatus Moranbacteria bacterium]